MTVRHIVNGEVFEMTDAQVLALLTSQAQEPQPSADTLRALASELGLSAAEIDQLLTAV
jgi:hypothetical protein